MLHFRFMLTNSLLIAMLVLSQSANAESRQYEIDVRAVALFGDGVPANDVIGKGIGGRYYLDDGWFISAGIENYTYDFERPIKAVGLNQDPTIKDIDAEVDTTVVSAGVGRKYGAKSARLTWFWDLGIGAGFPDVGNATGPLDTGGNFDIKTDAGTEFHLMGKLGTSFHFTPQWAFNVVARAEHHFMDFAVTEVNSGNTGKVDSHSPLGVHFSVSFRF